MKNCYILVGPPASGKSTWIEKQEGFYSIDGFERMLASGYVLSSDDIIAQISLRYDMTYNEGFPDLIKFADKAFWGKIQYYANYVGACDLYMDRTNMSVKSRSRYFEMLRPRGYKFHAIVFPKPEDAEHQRRLNSRPGKTIPQHVIDSMMASYQEPTFEEGFDTITFID